MKTTIVAILTIIFAGCLDPEETNDFDPPPPGVAGHCVDGVKNQDEAAIDCGGIHCDGCPNTTPCAEDYDCESSYCYDLGTGDGRTCIDPMQAPVCENRALDVGETDVDCGGSCEPCHTGRYCMTNEDCASGECIPTTNHPDVAIGQCWGGDYSGCTPVFYETVGLDAYCGERVLVMCQLHLPAAMLDRCHVPNSLPMTTDANLICCDSQLF